MAGKYRLYIDESGTHNYSKSESIGKRYLSLTGVIISEEENINMLQPAILAMRRLVADDPDDLPNLHREEIVNKSGPFSKLGNPAIEAEFNSIYLPIIRDMEYALCTVVLDKKSHLERYQGSAHHPYHYCMDLLLERYVLFLEERGGRGDVIAEARGKTEDKPLMEKYTQFYESGTFFCKPNRIQRYLTSKEIKVKPKSKFIAGLEFADSISLPSKFDVLHEYDVIPPLTQNFTKVIVDIIQEKYRKSPSGRSKGFGKKFIK